VPVDIIILAVVALLVIAAIYLVANAGSKTKAGKANAVVTWAATSALVFFVGGGILMFCVFLVFLLAGDDVARVILPVVALIIVASPVLVAIGMLVKRGV
jgi:hypothetical protein